MSAAKTATRWQVMQTAAAELGYVESGGRDGKSGNITKFWESRFPAWQGQPWCGAFVDWVLAKRGVDGWPVGRNGIFYTPSIVASAKSKGVWRSDSTESLSRIQPGDLVLFDFGSGGAQHVGFAERYVGGGIVQTIEGNTSPTNRGSQNNGGGTYRRQRSAATIMGYVDMSTWLAKDASELAGRKAPTGGKAPASSLRKTWLAKKLMPHGRLSVATVKRLQAQVNVPVDGQMGPQTRKAVQRWLGVTADGVWGKKTYSAMQRKVGGKTITGRWSPWLCTALQRWLNDHRVTS